MLQISRQILMIERDSHIRALRRLFSNHAVVVLTGSRDAGKTTLAKEFALRWRWNSYYFDLGRADDRAQIEGPRPGLAKLQGLVILDEIHRCPEALAVVRELAQRTWTQARFLLLSSIHHRHLRDELEPLQDLLAHYELPGLLADEVPVPQLNTLWLRGGLPNSFTADGDRRSYAIRERHVRDFLERDIYRLTGNTSVALVERFWTMLAQCHGEVWNGSELARSLGVSHHTARRYLEILESAFLVRRVQAWQADLPRRQVKSPKVYFRDSGLLHYCLGITTYAELERHPRSWASWEGFIVENLMQSLGHGTNRYYFWAAHTGAKVDLIAQTGAVLRGFAIRRNVRPRLTRTLQKAMDELSLARIDIVHAGPESFSLGSRSRAYSAERLREEL